MLGVTKELPRGKTELTPRYKLTVGDYVTAADVTRSGTLGVAGVGDGTVVGFDAASGRECFRKVAHEGGVLGVSFSPDGSHFLTCGQEPSAKLWHSSGEVVRELPGGGGPWVEHVSWSPSGDKVAIASGRKVRLWSAAGEALLETEPLASTASALAWRADGTAVAAACYGGVHIWPVVPHAKARHLAWKGSLISMAWSPNAKVIACGSQDCSVHFWRLASGKDSEMSGYPFKPKALAWDAESKLLATSGDAMATVWDFRGRGPEGSRPIQLSGHQGVVTCLTFNPQKPVLATGSQDCSILLWEPRRGSKPVGYAFMEDEVTVLAWNAPQNGLLAADAGGNVSFFEVA
jgi:WD40 repeat protein